jgi:lambda family phage portal protein
VRADSSLAGEGVPTGPIHRGAALGRRTDHIFAPEVGPIAGLARDLPLLTRRSRGLQRQISWARNARLTYIANAVGSGITPIFRYESEAEKAAKEHARAEKKTASATDTPLPFGKKKDEQKPAPGKPKTAAYDPTSAPDAPPPTRPTPGAQAPADGVKPWAHLTRELWNECVPYWDAAGLLDFYGLQALVWSEMFEAGECFVRRRLRRSTDELPVPLQIQILESEHCPHWYHVPNLGNGGWIRSGIEFGPLGDRRAYWMYPEHPGEWSYNFNSSILKRIPADQIAHVFVPERAESIRGCPHLARSILRLYGLDEYDDAEMDRQRMNAMITGVVELLDPEKVVERFGREVMDRHRTAPPLSEVEPGTVVTLGPGESYKPSDTADPGSNYKPFHDHNLRAVAADCGLTNEMLTGDLSNASYVTLKFGREEFKKRCKLLQGIFNFQFNQTVTGWWMDAAVRAGELEAPGYEIPRERRAYQRVLWVPPAWERLQPDKEIPADVAECRAGLNTADRIIAERIGEAGITIREEIEAINADLDERGIIATSDARVPEGGGKTPTSAQKEHEEAEAKAEALGKVTEDSADAKADGSNVAKKGNAPKKTGTEDA